MSISKSGSSNSKSASVSSLGPPVRAGNQIVAEHVAVRRDLDVEARRTHRPTSAARSEGERQKCHVEPPTPSPSMFAHPWHGPHQEARPPGVRLRRHRPKGRGEVVDEVQRLGQDDAASNVSLGKASAASVVRSPTNVALASLSGSTCSTSRSPHLVVAVAPRVSSVAHLEHAAADVPRSSAGTPRCNGGRPACRGRSRIRGSRGCAGSGRVVGARGAARAVCGCGRASRGL